MSFRDSIASFQTAVGKEADKVLRSSALAVFTKVVKRTPVDTGRLRGNWQVGINSAPSGVIEEEGGSVTLNQARIAMSKASAGNDVYIVNNLPYAMAIENGSSDQAPKGMVKVTVAEWKQFVRSAVK